MIIVMVGEADSKFLEFRVTLLSFDWVAMGSSLLIRQNALQMNRIWRRSWRKQILFYGYRIRNQELYFETSNSAEGS